MALCNVVPLRAYGRNRAKADYLSLHNKSRNFGRFLKNIFFNSTYT